MNRAQLFLCAALISGLASACASKTSSGNPGTAGTGAAGTGAAGTGAAGTTATTTPTTLTTATGCTGIDLVVVGSTLYWTDTAKGTVNSIPTAGGAPTVIATAQTSPGPLAADATQIFWANGDNAIMKQPLPTGTATTFVPAGTMDGGTDKVNALLVSGTNLFIGRGLTASKVATTGGTPTIISQSVEGGSPGAFAFDGTYLYQTERDHNAITRETIDGTQSAAITDGGIVKLSPTRLSVSRGSLVTDAIGLQSGYVVWANGPGIEAKATTGSESVAELVIASTPGFNATSGFVVSGGNIYLGESSDDNVEKVAFSTSVTAGSPPVATVIATNQKDASQFAADATNIYWRTTDCNIVKLAK